MGDIIVEKNPVQPSLLYLLYIWNWNKNTNMYFSGMSATVQKLTHNYFVFF